jgi:hypothetical protein
MSQKMQQLILLCLAPEVLDATTVATQKLPIFRSVNEHCSPMFTSAVVANGYN